MSTVQEATFDYHPYELHRLETGPETSTLLTREEVLKYYHQMVSIRRIETAAANLYNEKEIRGFCHGLCYHLLPCSRVHPCDGSPCVGCAREAGWKEERGDQVHMYTKNFYCRNGIVGDQVPLVAGIAFVHKYKGNGGVDFSLYGDGAANQGQVFEAFNLAKLWNLRLCLYVRTTITEWEHLRKDMLPQQISTREETTFQESMLMVLIFLLPEKQLGLLLNIARKMDLLSKRSLPIVTINNPCLILAQATGPVMRFRRSDRLEIPSRDFTTKSLGPASSRFPS